VNTDTDIKSSNILTKIKLFNQGTVKQIFIVSFLIAIIYPLINIYFILPSFKHLLIDNIEDEAKRTAKYLETRLILDRTMPGKGHIPDDFIKSTEQLMETFNIEKVKVFSDTGEIIYSTTQKDIGKINKKSYFHENVAKGEKYTKVVQRDTKTLEDRVVSVDVVETYLPIMSDDTFNGAFEIYYDITERKKVIESLAHRSTHLSFSLMAVFFISVILIILVSEKNIPKPPIDRTLKKYQSPFYCVLILAISIFIAEGTVMLIIPEFSALSVAEAALFDAGLLVLMLSPILYFFLARPLVLNIAVQNQINEKLQQAIDYSKKIFETSIAGIVETDAKGYIVKVNEAYLHMFGYEIEDIIGKHTVELSPTEAGLYETSSGEKVQVGEDFFNVSREMIEKLFEQGKVKKHEGYILQKDGKIVFTEENSVLIYNQQKEVIAAVSNIQNITERKTNETKREQLLKELQTALEEIKTIKGIIPICMHCKGIRDDKGSWSQLEKFITEHSEAEFSHGICEECLKKYYPEEYEDE
jgi:PAS domain-containing protein